MGNEMGNNNTSSLKEVKEESVRVDAPNGSSQETVKENDVKGGHLIAEDDSKDSHERAEDLAFHRAIAGDNHVDQSISDPPVLSQATHEVNDRYVEDQLELLSVNPDNMKPSMESDIGERDKSDSQLSIEAADTEVEKGETNSTLTVLSDSETQTSDGVKTDPIGLDKVEVSASTSDACGSEVSREDFLGSTSTFLDEGSDPMLETETLIIMNVSSLSDADVECVHLKFEQEQVEDDKASNAELLTINNESRLEDRTVSNFLNFGHEEQIDEATTVGGSTLQSEDSVADHSLYSHPEVSELKDQSGLVMEEIEFASSRLVNENNIKDNGGPVGHSDEPCSIQPEMAEAKDVSEMVVGLETITDDVGNTVEVPLDCPSDKECKVTETDVTENGCRDAICAEASEDFLESIEGEDCSMPISVEPEAGDINHDEKELTEREMIEDKHVETELSQATADETSRKDIIEQFIPVHSPYIRDSFSSFDYPVIISHPVSATKASGNQCNSESQQCQMPVTPGADTKLEKISGSLSTGLKSYSDTHIHPQLQKFPSFDFDLLIGSRSEESDQTPLLFPDRSTFRSTSMKGRCDRAKQVECLEEKTVRMDRSDSEKSRTPFLGLSKREQEDDEKQEACAVATSQKQAVKEADSKASKAKAMWGVPTEEVGSTSPKGKEKRKLRSSLFGNCMCCATVIN
ncbi:uncharacterized protein LOC115750260 [Rhodamnia argentea]|uniref:Uncharacterized protein LOC115750260 n=1 Tax=Rhodamnia argentea TaxID=178133 RepID=A0A8B8QAT0_9MYRT|nr:uncharacterized protein LOC115750260 [Rhodamnia argentea]